MKTILFRMMALVAVVALAAFGGCSSDDPAAPSGGGGGGNASFSLPAGTYNTMISVETCAGAPIENQSSVEVWCKAEVVDELPGGLQCEPTPVGSDSATVDCSGSVDEPGCSYDWTATGGGNRVGDMWTLNIRVEVTNQNPPGCAPLPDTCLVLTLSADMVSGPPTACTYADENTFDATVGGGPMAGKVPFRLGGSGFPDPGGISWSFGGEYPERIFAVASSRGGGQGWSIAFTLDAVDPKSLPRTLNVSAAVGQLVNSAGQTEGFVSYHEYDSDTGHDAYSNGGGGTVTVNEVSAQHIAGTISLNLDMLTYSIPGASATQETSPRTITGGFFVIQQGIDQQASFAATLGQRMLQSLRSHVE